MGWEISKEFEIVYGHRVWTQKLDQVFSLDNICACRRIHGHSGKINIYLTGDTLDSCGMVSDFKNLGWFKKWLGDVVDHKFIIDLKDPLLKYEVETLLNAWDRVLLQDMLIYQEENDCYIIDEKFYNFLEPVLQEKYEGMVFVQFVPTSENLSKWIFEVVNRRMQQIGVRVSKVEFYETPKSKATYINTEK